MLKCSLNLQAEWQNKVICAVNFQWAYDGSSESEAYVDITICSYPLARYCFTIFLRITWDKTGSNMCSPTSKYILFLWLSSPHDYHF